MSARSLPREYRISRGRATGVVAAVGVTSVLGMLPLRTAEDLSAPVKWSIALPLFALFAWLVTASLRASTTADLKGIRVRGFVGTRRLAWGEIQDIRVEVNPGAGAQQGPARTDFVSYAYRADGRRVPLMYLDDATVDLEREVGVLRAAWEELRGEDWTRSPDVARRIERGEARRLALMSGFAWAMLSFVPLMVLMFVPLFADVPGPLETVLSPLVVLGVGLPAVFAVGAVLSYRKRVRLLSGGE
ncbi:PH domain-containing protein [Streptomyces sp. NPDC014676]|uniref:PH domain-containing protein n=1 Tax=Streptomyces sp. NPDC014676 TaxID=3364879 RepID=UPI0036FDD3F1